MDRLEELGLITEDLVAGGIKDIQASTTRLRGLVSRINEIIDHFEGKDIPGGDTKNVCGLPLSGTKLQDVNNEILLQCDNVVCLKRYPGFSITDMVLAHYHTYWLQDSWHTRSNILMGEWHHTQASNKYKLLAACQDEAMAWLDALDVLTKLRKNKKVSNNDSLIFLKDGLGVMLAGVNFGSIEGYCSFGQSKAV